MSNLCACVRVCVCACECKQSTQAPTAVPPHQEEGERILYMLLLECKMYMLLPDPPHCPQLGTAACRRDNGLLTFVY